MARSDEVCLIDDPPCDKPAMGRGWCSMHYATWRKYGNPVHPDAEAKRRTKQGMECSDSTCHEKPKSFGLCIKHLKRSKLYGDLRDPYERKFWAKVDRRSNDECWPWTGYIAPNGYGTFGAHTTKTRLPHRIAYQFLIGPIPEGLVLDHLCHTRDPQCTDNDACPHRRCCNPAHLEPVTRRENVRRGRSGDYWGYTPEPVAAKPLIQVPLTCTEDNGQCGNPIYKRTICRKHYRRWLRDPNVERPSQRTPEQRFWMKVDKNGPVPEHKPELGQCWVWTASINPKTGYGAFARKHGEPIDAHRYSYEIANDGIPEGYQVHHKCHRRSCVRPEHLSATTRSENMALRKKRR